MDTERTEKPNFEGYPDRDCGEHRTVGPHRAWCYDCSEWCYPDGGDHDPRGGACKGCQVPYLRAELDDTRAEWVKKEFILGEAIVNEQLRSERAEDALAQRDATIARALALHTPGLMLDHYEYGCTCGFRDHRKSVCDGCGYVLNDEGEFDRGIHGRVCPTVAALGGEPETAEPARCPHGKTEAHWIREFGVGLGAESCPGPAASGTPEATT